MPFLMLEEAILGCAYPWWQGGKLEPSMELARLTLEPARHIFDLKGGVCVTKHFWYWTWIPNKHKCFLIQASLQE